MKKEQFLFNIISNDLFFPLTSIMILLKKRERKKEGLSH